MKHAAVFVLLVAVAMCTEDHYTTKYDGINVSSVLKNKRLVDNYVRCLLDKGKCNDEGRILKEVIPDALITDCKKCTPIQRTSVELVIRHLVKNRRTDFDEVAAKYDPNGTYRAKYEKYLTGTV